MPAFKSRHLNAMQLKCILHYFFRTPFCACRGKSRSGAGQGGLLRAGGQAAGLGGKVPAAVGQDLMQLRRSLLPAQLSSGWECSELA